MQFRGHLPLYHNVADTQCHPECNEGSPPRRHTVNIVVGRLLGDSSLTFRMTRWGNVADTRPLFCPLCLLCPFSNERCSFGTSKTFGSFGSPKRRKRQKRRKRRRVLTILRHGGVYRASLRSGLLSLTQSKLCLRHYPECACARYSPEQALLAVIPIRFIHAIHAFTHSRIHRGVNDVNDVNNVNDVNRVNEKPILPSQQIIPNIFLFLLAYG